MNESLKKFVNQIKDLWSKWKLVQKIIFFAIIAVVIVAIVLLITLSSRSTDVVLFNVVQSDEKTQSLVMELQNEGIDAKVNSAKYITVKDEATARKARNILYRQGYIDDFDPWTIFDTEKWNITDFERDINKQRAAKNELEKFLKSYEEVDDATVIINVPQKTVYSQDQQPKSVSVLLTLRPNNNFENDKKVIKGMQKMIIMATGVSEENLTISDTEGHLLNDFEGAADFDRMDLKKRQQKLKTSAEKDLKTKVLSMLQKNYGADRVRAVEVTVDWDFSEEEYEEITYSPFVKKSDNPDTPYDDSEIADSVTLSSEVITKEWTGSPINPEGPSGVEGQTPAVYADMQNMYGTSKEQSVKKNEAINQRNTKKKVETDFSRRSVAVMIDGTWDFAYDENGEYIVKNGKRERVFHDVPPEEIKKIEDAVKSTVNYDKNRGDVVTVISTKIDRTAEFDKADADYMRKKNTRKTIFYALIGIVAVLIVFLVVRFILKEVERKKREAEEERLRAQQLEREKVLWNAEQASMDVSMTVEDRHKAELQDQAISAAKEHPQDVAQLIRTWLMEE